MSSLRDIPALSSAPSEIEAFMADAETVTTGSYPPVTLLSLHWGPYNNMSSELTSEGTGTFFVTQISPDDN